MPMHPRRSPIRVPQLETVDALHVRTVRKCRAVSVDRRAIAHAVRVALGTEGIARGEVCVAIVADAEIATIHGRFLNDPTPTDCISFVYSRAKDCVDGEIVVSAETASAQAPAFGWSAEEELLLYVIHGALHLAGLGDQGPAERRSMRRRERHVLAEMGILMPGGPTALRGSRPISRSRKATRQQRGHQ